MSFGRLKPREVKSVVQGHTAKGEIKVAEGENLWFLTPPSSEVYYLYLKRKSMKWFLLGAGGKRSDLIRVKEYSFLESGKPARSRELINANDQSY